MAKGPKFKVGQVVLCYDGGVGPEPDNMTLIRVLRPFSWLEVWDGAVAAATLAGADLGGDNWPERLTLEWLRYAGYIEFVDHVVFDPSSNGKHVDGVFIPGKPEEGNQMRKLFRQDYPELFK